MLSVHLKIIEKEHKIDTINLIAIIEAIFEHITDTPEVFLFCYLKIRLYISPHGQ